MEHFFPRDIITITTSMAIEDMPGSNDNNVNASPGNTNKTFDHSNSSTLKQILLTAMLNKEFLYFKYCANSQNMGTWRVMVCIITLCAHAEWQCASLHYAHMQSDGVYCYIIRTFRETVCIIKLCALEPTALGRLKVHHYAEGLALEIYPSPPFLKWLSSGDSLLCTCERWAYQPSEFSSWVEGMGFPRMFWFS